MSLLKGEAPAFMTRMVNDTAGYVTLIAALTFIVILIDKRGYPGVGAPMAIIYGLSAIILLGYWVVNTIEQCRKFRAGKKSFLAGLHTGVIAFVIMLSCVGAVVVAIATFMDAL